MSDKDQKSIVTPTPKPAPQWWQNQPGVSKFKAPKTGRDFTGMRRGSR